MQSKDQQQNQDSIQRRNRERYLQEQKDKRNNPAKQYPGTGQLHYDIFALPLPEGFQTKAEEVLQTDLSEVEDHSKEPAHALPKTEAIQKHSEVALQIPDEMQENTLLPDPPFKYSVQDSKKGGYWLIIRECYPVYHKANNVQEINKIFLKMKALNGGRTNAKAGDTVLVPQEAHFQIPTSQRKPGVPQSPKPTQNRTPIENSGNIYTLTHQESLWKASQRLGVNLHAWLRYNNLELPSGGNGSYYLRLPSRSQKIVLAPGDTLKIPPQSPLYDTKKPKEEAPQTVTKPRKPVEDLHKPAPKQNPKQAPKSQNTVNNTKPQPKTKQEIAREIHSKYHHDEIAQEVKKHIRDKALVQEVINLQSENSKDNLAYQITQSLSDSELDKTPVPVLNLLQNTMQDSWVGNHQTAITRIEKAKQRIAQRLQEEEKKKNEPLYRLQELFKKPELSPEQIAQARQLIQKLPTSTLQGDYFEKLQYKVPYFNQRDSEVSGYVGSGAYCNLGDYMCNMSSMAMGLALFGVSNPKPDMQYDDAVEQVRIDHYPSYKRTGEGQFRIANHFGYKYESLDGKGSETGLWGEKESYLYDWYVQHVLPHLRKGNAITIGIALGEHGHIVHLLGITKQGLSVHNPYGKVDFEQTDYAKTMNNFANTREGVGSDKGKKEFWSFEAIKNSPKLHISWIRVTRPK